MIGEIGTYLPGVPWSARWDGPEKHYPCMSILFAQTLPEPGYKTKSNQPEDMS